MLKANSRHPLSQGMRFGKDPSKRHQAVWGSLHYRHLLEVEAKTFSPHCLQVAAGLVGPDSSAAGDGTIPNMS